MTQPNTLKGPAYVVLYQQKKHSFAKKGKGFSGPEKSLSHQPHRSKERTELLTIFLNIESDQYNQWFSSQKWLFPTLIDNLASEKQFSRSRNGRQAVESLENLFFTQPNYLLVQDVTFLNRSLHSFISIRDNNLAKKIANYFGPKMIRTYGDDFVLSRLYHMCNRVLPTHSISPSLLAKVRYSCSSSMHVGGGQGGALLLPE